jgi:DNA helicase II / ATP-dependent DNA helicase PcrA
MVGESAFRTVCPQYRRGSYLNDTVANLGKALTAASSTSTTAREAVDEVVGFDVLPAMTIHKSKGLEFHTVIFLGLEDSQWWAFANQADEEKRGFFVAFSRASERVYFTFSDVRDERWGRRPQRKAQIGDLYTILKKAGISTANHRRGA